MNLLLLNRTGLERGFSFNGPAWSISTEFVVNVLFLAAIALPRNLVRAGMFALFAALLAVIVACGLISDATARGSAIDIFSPIVGFCRGVALHRVHAYWMPRINLNRGFADGLAVAAVSGFLCYSPQGEMAGLFHRLVVVICFPALIVGAIHGGAVRWILTLPQLVYLGTISYSIYLVHFPLQLGVHLASVAFLIQMPYDSALFLVGFFVATAGLASITYRLIEMPGKNLLQGRPVSMLAKSLDQSLDLGNPK